MFGENADAIAPAPEDEGPDRCGDERRRARDRRLERADMPLGLEQFEDDADDEEVVCVGKKAHAGDQDDAPLRGAHLVMFDLGKSGG
jgi:hypothetical protein